jgi:hypothetical protein
VPFASQIFYIEETGVYRMSMGQAGEPNPAVILFAMIPGETQLHAIADFDAATEGVFSFEAELTGGLFYVAQFQQPSYQLPSVNNGQSFSVRYSFRITPVDEREPR